MFYPEDSPEFIADPFLDWRGPEPHYGAAPPATLQAGSPEWIAAVSAFPIEAPLTPLPVTTAGSGSGVDAARGNIVTISAPGAVWITAEQWNSPKLDANQVFHGNPITDVRKIAPFMWQFYTQNTRDGCPRTSAQCDGTPNRFGITSGLIIATAWYPDGTWKNAPDRRLNQADLDRPTPKAKNGEKVFGNRQGMRRIGIDPRPRIVGSDITQANPWHITPSPAGRVTVKLPGGGGALAAAAQSVAETVLTYTGAGASAGNGGVPSGNGGVPANGNGGLPGNGNGNGNGYEEPTWWDDLPLAAKATGGAVVGVGVAWLAYKLINRG